MAHGPTSAAREKRLTMVCYARPAIRMAALVLVVLLIFARSGAHFFPGHFFGTAALMVAVTAAAGGAAVAAALTFAAVGSIRRRHAAAGRCVHCQFRCQQAMTGPPRRRPVVRATRAEAATPRWPDRPAYRGAAASQPAGHAERQARAGSPAHRITPAA
jgi:hypothetical protein